MTFILGTSRLSYDHFGAWPLIRHTAIEQTPFGLKGDTSGLAECSLGTFMLGESLEAVNLTIEVY